MMPAGHRYWSQRQQLIVLCGDEGVAETWLALRRAHDEHVRDVIEAWDELLLTVLDDGGQESMHVVETIRRLADPINALRSSRHVLRQYDVGEIEP